jgi:putative endonuclease
MAFYVYMLKSITVGTKKSYVGYTTNIKHRLKKHNSNRGAKTTKGYKWIVIYKRYFKTKNEAMSYEYRLKNDKRKRSKLLKNENFNSTTL